MIFRKFPTHSVAIYFVAHIVTGLIVSILELSKRQWLTNLLAPVDTMFPAFKTFFVFAKDPLGCKVMLLLWWLVFIPWGIVWAARFFKGFRAVNRPVILGTWSKIKFLGIGLFFLAMLSYGNSLMDHSENLASASLKIGRSSIVPFLTRHGPEYFSIYLAGMSLLYVIFSSLVLLVVLDYFYQSKLAKKA